MQRPWRSCTVHHKPPLCDEETRTKERNHESPITAQMSEADGGSSRLCSQSEEKERIQSASILVEPAKIKR